jgi:hypothetical protein
MRDLLNNYGKITDLDYNKLFASTSTIKNDFYKIWNIVIQKTQLNISVDTAVKEFKNLTIYEAVDGSRSTLNQNLDRGEECVLYVINFIHTLRALGAKTCLVMIHSSYNRKRGEKEVKNILHDIEIGSALIKKYGIQNNICCSCICINEDYELIDLLKDVTESTKDGEFCAYFLFDYNEKWAMTEKGQNIIKNLPNIDVHIRHTKFQFSGGWIPDKMSRSVFLYSQNGTTYSNWKTDELVTLMALSLLAKLLHKGESLDKIYTTTEEINQRYKLRELQLFNKVIELRANPKKLFMMGSPVGVYQFYY